MKPVAWHEPGSFGNVTIHEKWALENGWLPLYAAPVDTKAIRAEAMEEAAKVFEEMQRNGNAWVSTVAAAAAIMGLK